MTEKIKIWSFAGFAVSPLSHERHEELVERLRIEAGTRKSKQAPLASILANLGDTSDLVGIVGWNVDTDPGILISGKALHQDEAFWREAYPEGFVVCDQPLSRLLLIDFDEDSYAIEELVFSNRN
ncbi:MAG: hypothetical protein ACSLE1_17080 [Sphingobium sp.]